tara:strand:- start:14318 stop:14689 length:372 start_codon:yes stop_codon:yes gene_type:complete
MQRNFEDKVRQLSTTKSYAPKIVKRKPSSEEGREGDIALGLTSEGIKLYAKLGNKWYTFTADESKNSIEGRYTINNLTASAGYDASESRNFNATSFTSPNIVQLLATLIKDLSKLGFLKSKIS